MVLDVGLSPTRARTADETPPTASLTMLAPACWTSDKAPTIPDPAPVELVALPEMTLQRLDQVSEEYAGEREGKTCCLRMRSRFEFLLWLARREGTKKAKRVRWWKSMIWGGVLRWIIGGEHTQQRAGREEERSEVERESEWGSDPPSWAGMSRSIEQYGD